MKPRHHHFTINGTPRQPHRVSNNTPTRQPSISPSINEHAMNNSNEPVPLKYYPAYCFSVSPTFHTWVKVTAADVHALKTREGFEGTLLLYLSGPKHYKVITPMSKWEIYADSERTWSGQKIYFHLNHPIKWIRLVGVIVSFDDYEKRWIMLVDDSSGATLEISCAKAPAKDKDANANELGNGNGTGDSQGTSASWIGVDLSGVDVGSVVKVKGGIGEFRGVKQMTLERISVFIPIL